MSDLPYDAALLEKIDRDTWRGHRPRPVKSKERDRLQSLGLIESAKPGGARSIQTTYWRPTDKGRQEAETNRKEGLV